MTVLSGKLYVLVYFQHTVQQLGVPDDINRLPSSMYVPALVAGSLLTFSCHDFIECSGASLSADLVIIPKIGLRTTVYWLFNCVNVLLILVALHMEFLTTSMCHAFWILTITDIILSIGTKELFLSDMLSANLESPDFALKVS